MTDEGDAGRPTAIRIGALLLMGMGFLSALLALVFVAYAGLFATRGSLPAWVQAPDLPGSASAQLIGFGLVALAFAGAQVAAGWLAYRGGMPLARWAGAALALIGAAVVALAMLPRQAGQGALVALFPGILAYAWVLVSFALEGRWFADAGD
ncbi:MAG TPA: hypothetical protein VF013_03330 [Candidatus Limnocylindria bacterium]